MVTIKLQSYYGKLPTNVNKQDTIYFESLLYILNIYFIYHNFTVTMNNVGSIFTETERLNLDLCYISPFVSYRQSYV